MIKTEFWDDPKSGKLTDKAQLLFIGMLNFADDGGVVRGDTLYLKSKIFPYKENSLKEIEKSINELESSKLIFRIVFNNDLYFWIHNFLKHQVVTNPSKHRYISGFQNDNYSTLCKDYDRAIIELSPKEKENVKEKEKENVNGMAKEIIDYLNLKANKNFQYIEKHFGFINARLKENFTLDDFKKAIDNKCAEWLNTDMDKFLRPETLFGNKMDGYINQKPIKKKINSSYVSNDFSDVIAAQKKKEERLKNG